MKNINEIENNSYEAVVLFAVYICYQDGKVSDEEASELFLQSDVMKNFYFECYGEVCDLDIEETTIKIRDFLASEESFFSPKPTNNEIKFFNNLISDNKLRDIALLISKLAASNDEFVPSEESKWQFWYSKWV